MSKQTKLSQIVRRFRILRNWTIEWARGQKYRGQVTISPERNRAIVHPWGSNTPEPADFRLHETLHCALRALTAMDKRHRKELLQAQELLVQDICAVLHSMKENK